MASHCLWRARADERVDQAAEGAEQHVPGVAGAEVAGEAAVAHHELQGAAGDGVGVAVGRRRVAQVVDGADADAGAQRQRRDAARAAR